MRTLFIAVLFVFTVLILASIVVVEVFQGGIAKMRRRSQVRRLNRAYAAPSARAGDYPAQDWCRP
jgi:hypothetical protein